MYTDRYGNEVSAASREAFDHYAEGVDRMLAAEIGAEDELTAALAADPDFALAKIALARQHHLFARGREARTLMEESVALAEHATPRERRHVEIIARLIGGDMVGSLALAKEHAAEHPRDAFALSPACGVFGSIGFSGRPGWEAEHSAFVEPLAPHYGDDWWFLTVHAFALLESGDWIRGREFAERAVEQRPSNAHAAHTLAHALFEAGADEDSRAFLEGWIDRSTPEGLMHCHNWWHLAMVRLATGDVDGAFSAVAGNCMPGTSESPSINVLTDCVAFLWRAELAGIPRRTDLWEALRDYYDANFRRPIVFVDAHVGLIHAALGDDERLTACIEELEALGEGGKLPAGTTAATLTRAYRAFAAEDWNGAIERLEPAMDQVVRIGGSRAQRDLQVNTLIAAYVNAGRDADARALAGAVEERQPTRPVAGLERH